MEIWNCFEQRGAAWGIKTRGEWRVTARVPEQKRGEVR